MFNIHTWARIARFDLQYLSVSLGNAAIQELANWPANGDGRKVKDLTEKITRSLESTFDRRDLNYSFDVLEDILAKFQEIKSNEFYITFLANKSYRDRKGSISTYEEMLTVELRTLVSFINDNRPPRSAVKSSGKDRAKLAKSPSDTPPLSTLTSVVPAQQSAPLQFEVKDSRLRLKRQPAKADAEDRRNVTLARAALQSDANALLIALSETNADPRLSGAITEIRDVISSEADVIRLGLISLTCENFVVRFSEQLPDVVSAKLEGLSASLSLFVSQFAEWQQFIAKAHASASLSIS